jgi:carboxymethylenebutenolidase
MAMTTADCGALLDQIEEPGRLAAVGYCMGAWHALAAAVRFPQRVGAVAMLHGGRLVTDGPDSPHLLIDRLRLPAYVAFAADDPTCPPGHQALPTEAFAANARAHGRTHRIESFEARHGWMFPERHCHDPAAASRANAAMAALFGAALAKEAS